MVRIRVSWQQVVSHEVDLEVEPWVAAAIQAGPDELAYGEAFDLALEVAYSEYNPDNAYSVEHRADSEIVEVI